MEHKQSEATIISVDEEKGIVEAVWAVMGNVDETKDIIHPGAFTKTFSERSNQIKLLDNHRTDTVMSALGTVKQLREVKRAELPQDIMYKYPDVTGGASGQFQFLLNTPEGLGVFNRIKSGAIREWSFGYDAVDKDYSTKDGETVRNLRGIRLYEISPVLFPANQATITTSAKSKPTEEKPYRAIREGQVWKVYKLDANGEPTGESLGEHANEDEAQGQVRALYASENGKDKTDKSNDGNTEEKSGRVLSAKTAGRIREAMSILDQCLKDAMVVEDNENDGPQDDTPLTSKSEAGPESDASTRLLKLIEIERESLKLLEV